MKDHFGFTDEEYKKLLKNGVSVEQLFKFANEYKVGNSLEQMSFVNLFIYVDLKGDFTTKPDFPSKKICRAMFEKLNDKQKVEISNYISDLEDKLF